MPCGDLLRRLRRVADLSQRELAKKAELHLSVVSRIEAGRVVPTLATLERLLAATGFILAVVGPDGQVIDAAVAGEDKDVTRDGAGRHFPAHLDARKPSRTRPWWYEWRDTMGVKAPLLTFSLSRCRRDTYRRADNRTARDPDERMRHPNAQSRVLIPGYRPVGQQYSSYW